MPRGGKRPGAGRKRKIIIATVERDFTDLTPIDLGKIAAVELAKKKDWKGLARAAALLAPYYHPKIPVSRQAGAFHRDQKLLDDQLPLPLPPAGEDNGRAPPDEFDGLLN
jgi:hypothetical protein